MGQLTADKELPPRQPRSMSRGEARLQIITEAIQLLGIDAGEAGETSLCELIRRLREAQSLRVNNLVAVYEGKQGWAV